MTLLSRIAIGAAGRASPSVEQGGIPGRVLKLGDLVHGPRPPQVPSGEPGSWNGESTGEGEAHEFAHVSEPTAPPSTNFIDITVPQARAATAVPQFTVMESHARPVAPMVESRQVSAPSMSAQHSLAASTPSDAAWPPAVAAPQFTPPQQDVGSTVPIDSAATPQPAATVAVAPPPAAPGNAQFIFDVGTRPGIATQLQAPGLAAASPPALLASAHLATNPVVRDFASLAATPPASAIDTAAAEATSHSAPATPSLQQPPMLQPTVARRADAMTAAARFAAPSPAPAAAPQPRVHIGSLEVSVEAPPAPAPRPAAPLRGASFASRHYLRGL